MIIIKLCFRNNFPPLVYSFKKLVYNISIYSQDHWYTQNTKLAANSIYKISKLENDKRLDEKNMHISNSSYVYFSQFLLANTGESAFKANKNNVKLEIIFGEVQLLLGRIYVIIETNLLTLSLDTNNRVEFSLTYDIESRATKNIEIIFFEDSATITNNKNKVEYTVKVISEFNSDLYKKPLSVSTSPFEYPYHELIVYNNTIINIEKNNFNLLSLETPTYESEENDNDNEHSIMDKLSYFVTIIMGIIVTIIVGYIIYISIKKWKRRSNLQIMNDETELKSQGPMKKVEII